MSVEAKEAPLSLMDITDLDTSEFWEEVRSRGDMYWDEGVQAYLVSSYELSVEMARMDNILWHSPLAPHPGAI